MDTPLESLSARIADAAKRTEPEILEQLAKLKKHWIRTVRDWIWLTEDRRVEVGLPLLLNSVIDAVAHSIASNDQANDKAPHSTVRYQHYRFQLEDRSKSSVLVRLGQSANCCELSYDDQMSKAIRMLLPTSTGVKIQLPNGELKETSEKIFAALCPGTVLYWTDNKGADCCARVETSYQLTSVDRWLSECELNQFALPMYAAGMVDFLCLPLLPKEHLTLILRSASAAEVVYTRIEQLSQLSSLELTTQWVRYLGVEVDIKELFEDKISPQSLLGYDCIELEQLGLAKSTAEQLGDCLRRYREFSSVEATYDWLLENGLDIFGVQFARSNIPYYVLPTLNYLILFEMGIVIDDYRVYERFRQLGNCPAFTALSLSMWLRDMELGGCQLELSRLSCKTVKQLCDLPIETVLQCVSGEYERSNLRNGIEEALEYLKYYSLTSSILNDLGAAFYTELFAIHGVSMDMLPLLTDIHLEYMGITSVTERRRVLSILAGLSSEPSVNGMGAGHRRQTMRNTLDSREQEPHFGNRLMSQPFTRPSSRGPVMGTPTEDSKTVEEWLRFIDGCGRSASKKKRRKRKKKKKKKKATAQDGSMEVAITSEPSSESTVDSNDCGGPPPSTDQLHEKDAALPRDVSAETVASGQATGSEDVAVSTTEQAKGTLSGSDVKELDGCTQEKIVATELQPLRIDVESSKADLLSPQMIPLEELLLNDEFSDEDDMDPELKAQLDAEVEAFRLRLECTHSKSKLTPVFYLPE